MTKILPLLALLLIGAHLGNFAMADTLPSTHDGSPTDGNIRYIGRWDRSDPALYHGYWGGVYLRTGFTGTSVGIKLSDGSGLSVSIDGEPPRHFDAHQGVTALNLAPLPPGRHTLQVGSSNQNYEVLFQGLQLDPGAQTEPLPARPLVEFIGDSITTGGGDGFLSYGDYAWKSAEALGCDHTQISFSARALTTGYGCADDKAALDTQYFCLKNFNHTKDSPQVPWDFSYTPQVIVINLGQNDQCGQEPKATFQASYIGFLGKLRAKFPRTQILAIRPFSNAYGDEVRAAVQSVNASGDTRVHFGDTTGWLNKDDFADGIHPTAEGHVKVARLLVPLLRPLVGGAEAAAAKVTVGDPAHPAALPQAVQNAYVAGASQIAIRPGVYVMPVMGHAVFSLDGWSDATISAYGATIILSDLGWGRTAFELTKCRRVTVEGGITSQISVTNYQGRVAAVGKDADGHATCDWRPDAGYPVPVADAKGHWPGSAINVIDGRTRTFKIGVGDYYNVPMDTLGNDLFRFHFDQPTLNFGVGDWVVGRYGNAPFKFDLVSSRDCVIKDVTMMRNGFANIREEGIGGGGNRFLHCIWAIGPRPHGATEEPVITNAADGFHSTEANPGPDIENCVFEGNLLDDCIAIHGYFVPVKSASGNTFTTDNASQFKVGEPARFSNNKAFFAEATVTDIKDNGDKTHTVTLDKALDIPADAKASNPLACGAGYKIVGCHLGNTRSRGLLLKGDNGLVKDNVIEGCGMPAVSLGPEYYWGESDYVQNVIVEGNTLRNNGHAPYGGSAILVHGDGATGNKNIVIRGNRMESNYQGDLQIEWVDGVTVANNTMKGALPWPSVMPTPSLISLANCQGVSFTGNVVRNAAAYKPTLVSMGQNVTDVKNADAPGIRTEASAAP